MREFDTGATRSDDDQKPDYEGFLSPRVIRLFGEYMMRHQTCEDGSTRQSDNWQRGIPLDSYMKSMFRHFVDLWELHRAGGPRADFREALGALMFNVQGYAHEFENKREEAEPTPNFNFNVDEGPEA